MDKLLDLLYNRFFLRDLLSIFSNGALFVYAMWKYLKGFYCFNDIIAQYLQFKNDDFFKYVVIIIIITLIYSMGLVINATRDFFYFLFFYKNGKKNGQKRKCFLTIHGENITNYYSLKIKLNPKDTRNYDYYKGNNDRLVIIFQTLGNTGIAFIILSFTFISECNIPGLIIFLLSGILMTTISLRVFVHHKILNKVMSKLS